VSTVTRGTERRTWTEEGWVGKKLRLHATKNDMQLSEIIEKLTDKEL